MEKSTNELITNLEVCTSMVELMEMIQKEHKKIKSSLTQKNVKFYKIGNLYSEDIIGNQEFVGVTNIYEAHYYDELNYIKAGLTSGWVTRLEEINRFQEIKNSVCKIIDQL